MTLNPGASLGGLYTRVDPVALPVVNAVANPNGTQSVNINQASQPSPDWSVVKDCTLNSHVGIRELPPGVYGNFQASDGAGLVLGDENASQPQEYQFQSLQLNGNAQIEVRGKVILRIKNNFSLQTVMGKVAAPGDLQIELPTSGMTLNSGARLYAKVLAPSGTVMITSNAQLHGGLVAQQLMVNSGGLLKLLELEADEGGGGEDEEPENQPPVVQLGEDQAVALPGGMALAAVSVSDDGLPAGSTLTYQWRVVSGNSSAVDFENAQSAQEVVHFTMPGEYRLRLTVSDGELSGADEMRVRVSLPNQPPVVNAGEGVGAGGTNAVAAGETHALSGVVQDDGMPVGEALITLWSVVSGDAAKVIFSDPSLPDGNVRFLESGSFTLRLTAHDGELEASDEITVTVTEVSNTPPMVDAGPAQQMSGTGNVLLLGAVSDDGRPSGGTLSYTAQWTG